MTDKRKVIFDTDIGDDDAVALAACLLSDKVMLLELPLFMAICQLNVPTTML